MSIEKEVTKTLQMIKQNLLQSETHILLFSLVILVIKVNSTKEIPLDE
jgi:hypothetical protein